MNNVPTTTKTTAEEEREIAIKQTIGEYVMALETLRKAKYLKQNPTVKLANGKTKTYNIRQSRIEKMEESIADIKSKLVNFGLSEEEIAKMTEETDSEWKKNITDEMRAFGKYEEKQKFMLKNSTNKEQESTESGERVYERVEPRTPHKGYTEYTPMIEELDVPQIACDKVENGNYDVIELPSGGQCYPCKRPSISVSMMTASDENLITSPNLYKDGLLIDYLLKKKVIDEKFLAEDLCIGDADAITLWLRATGYGNEFPVDITDPESGEVFSTVIDLSEIKTKPFLLKGDENGWFEYKTTPRKNGTFDTLKFKFLSRREERMLQKMDAYDNKSTQKLVILANLKEVTNILRNATELDGMSSSEREDILNRLHEWVISDSQEIDTEFSHLITNRMAMQIMSVNGNTDREFIKSYVVNMPSRDALEFRKYVINNEPGMDFKITVTRPESLGGGSFDTFLNWDDTIFFHIS